MITEGYLRWHSSFVASSSDFWSHPTWRKSFAAVIANFMTKGYYFKQPNLFLACSDTTMAKIKNSNLTDNLLRSEKAILHRVQALIQFLMYLLKKTGQNIGIMVEDSHATVNIKADYMGGCTVDNASNATKSTEEIKISTADFRSQPYITGTCTCHKANTTCDQGSGTSKHKKNLNPDLGASLKLLHRWVAYMNRSRARVDILDDVHKELGREKYLKILVQVITRWSSKHRKATGASANEYDFDMAIKRMLALKNN